MYSSQTEMINMCSYVRPFVQTTRRTCGLIYCLLYELLKRRRMITINFKDLRGFFHLIVLKRVRILETTILTSIFLRSSMRRAILGSLWSIWRIPRHPDLDALPRCSRTTSVCRVSCSLWNEWGILIIVCQRNRYLSTAAATTWMNHPAICDLNLPSFIQACIKW